VRHKADLASLICRTRSDQTVVLLYWLTVIFCRQSLGKAAAAALYTETVSQSVAFSRIQSLAFRVSRRIRIEHEAVSVLLAVSLNGNNESAKL